MSLRSSILEDTMLREGSLSTDVGVNARVFTTHNSIVSQRCFVNFFVDMFTTSMAGITIMIRMVAA